MWSGDFEERTCSARTNYKNYYITENHVTRCCGLWDGVDPPVGGR